jgi:hypothetical protein
METIIIHSESNKINGIIAFLEAFDVSFERKTTTENNYNSEFVSKIERSKQQAKEGKVTTIKTEDLWK